MFLWFMERPPRNKTSRIELLNLVGTARCAVRAAFSGATMPPADSRAGTSQRDVPTEVRFMGRGKQPAAARPNVETLRTYSHALIAEETLRPVLRTQSRSGAWLCDETHRGVRPNAHF